MLGLRANQTALHDAVAEMFAYEQAEDFTPCLHTCHQTVDKKH